MTDSGNAHGTRNFFDDDRELETTLERIAPGSLARWRGHLSEFGAWVANDVDLQAEHTHRHAPPALEGYDRDGNLTNRIRLNPLWEKAAREVYERGIVGLNYGADPAPFAITFAMGYMLAQADISLHCPVTMTGAVAYVLDRFAPPSVGDTYLGELTRTDGRALTGGTWATELHGGSDVGATTTTARAENGHFRLDGLKWFTSNPAGGLALATARPEGAPAGGKGLGLYLVPERLPDGSPNPMRIRRLKDKLGTLGIATAEIDLTDTWAVEVAAPPDGLRLMMEALEFSRIHNAMAGIGLQRRALAEARDYAAGRNAFGAAIDRYPMVQDELLHIMVAHEAGAALAFEAVRAFDAADTDETVRPWLRLVTALAKYRTADDAVEACRRAMEIIGGNGYTYDHVLPRLLRDAAVLPIWEGPANIQALEVLRLLGNRHSAQPMLEERVRKSIRGAPCELGEIAATVGRAFRECLDAIAFVQSDGAEAQRHARRLMDYLADMVSAALLLEEAGRGLAAGDSRKSVVARLYIEQRLDPPDRRGIAAGRDWSHRRFDDLMGHGRIRTAAKVTVDA
jgi:alkylation response protein AidB-like acyl-CoA dehydrogenase